MQNNIKFKDCLMEIYFYNLETNTWKFINCGGGPLQPRKNHASAILGRNLIIHGGLNSKDTILRDMWTLDLGNTIILFLIYETYFSLNRNKFLE